MACHGMWHPGIPRDNRPASVTVPPLNGTAKKIHKPFQLIRLRDLHWHVDRSSYPCIIAVTVEEFKAKYRSVDIFLNLGDWQQCKFYPPWFE